MGVIIALILLFVFWKWKGLRAYTACSLVLIGIGAAIAGCMMEDHFFVMPGLIMLLAGLFIAFLSVLRYEKSQWIPGMIHFLIYGFMLFLRIMAVCLIIGIPLMGMINAMCEDWEEVIVVDSLGRDTGRRAVVNSKGYDPYGRKYRR